MSWTTQNLPVALPIYDNWRKQSFRQSYCNGNPFVALSARYDALPAIMIKGESSTPDYVYLVNKAGTNAIDVMDFMALTADTFGSLDYVYSTSEPDVDQDAETTEHTGWNGTTWTTTPGENTWANFVRCGQEYYLEIKIGSNYYYTELFTITDFPETSTDPTDEDLCRIRIEASSTCAIDDIPPLMTQKIFIKAFTAEPEYPLDKSVSKTGSEVEKIKWAKIEKRYRIKFAAVESIADFCALLPLFTTVNVTDQYGDSMDVNITEAPKISWGDADAGGCCATIEIVYTRAFVQTQCC